MVPSGSDALAVKLTDNGAAPDVGFADAETIGGSFPGSLEFTKLYPFVSVPLWPSLLVTTTFTVP